MQGFSPYSLFSANNWLSPAISPGRGIANTEAKASVESNRDDTNQNSGLGRAAIMGTQVRNQCPAKILMADITLI